MGRHLVYTLALDIEGATGHRNLAKLLVSSLLRTRFAGDILVFHNSPAPLFMVARKGVREVPLEMVEMISDEFDFALQAQSYKHAIAAHIDPLLYDKVMFIDCDAVVLRNIHHLLAGENDLTVFAEPWTKIQAHCYGGYLTSAERAQFVREGFNSGTWAVAGSSFGELLRRWREVELQTPNDRGCMREQSAFNRVVLDWDGGAKVWPQHEIALPLCNGHSATYRAFMGATIVHAAGGDSVNQKLRFLFSAFAGTFLFDPQLALFNIMEM